MNTLSYITVDVFTSTRFEGNPLAVISDARGLSDAAMQKIATEFNYSEVTFVLPPEDPQNSAHVRIFTPTMEIPFAGHPNVGTAYVLGQQAKIFGKAVGDTLRFEEKAGIVEVSLKRSGGKVVATAIRAPQLLTIGDTIAAETIARCVSTRSQCHRQHHPCPGLCVRRVELRRLRAERARSTGRCPSGPCRFPGGGWPPGDERPRFLALSLCQNIR